jgi:hypothetical protein
MALATLGIVLASLGRVDHAIAAAVERVEPTASPSCPRPQRGSTPPKPTKLEPTGAPTPNSGPTSPPDSMPSALPYPAAIARYHEADARLRSRNDHQRAATAARMALATPMRHPTARSAASQ